MSSGVAKRLIMATPYVRNPYTGTNYQQTSYVPRPIQASSYDPSLALRQNAQAVSTVGNYPSGVNVSKVNQSWGSNLNPELRGGIADVNFGGQNWRVPNAVIQQLMYQDAWNQGRSNSLGDFFGTNIQAPQGMNNVDYGASQGRLQQLMTQNPQWTQEGALNPYLRAQQANNQAQGRVRNIQDELQNTVWNENRNLQGAMMGQDQYQTKQNELQDAQKQAQMTQNQYNQQNTRRNRYRGDQIASSITNDATSQLKDVIQPTFSNLRIKETYVN